MKRELRDLLWKAANDIPPFIVKNPLKTVKRAYKSGGIDKVIEVVNEYRKRVS